MTAETAPLRIFSCLRCRHQWPSRLDRKPKRCPGCKSPYWDFVKGSLPRGELSHRSAGREPIRPSTASKGRRKK